MFPSATGNTLQEAVENLDAKLKVLYTFQPNKGVSKWIAVANFKLKATLDCEEGEEQTFYDVSWLDIISDLEDVGTWFYETARDETSPTQRRDLHALLNFKYTGDFASLT